MTGLITIELKKLRFFAYHGLYEEEKRTGNEFEVNVIVAYPPVSGTVTSIDETINYVTIFELVKNEMDQPRELLETLAMEIAEHLHQEYRKIKRVEVTVTKLQPPMPSFTGHVSVTYSKQF
jgi:dihydroneopterin aldolase